MDDGDGGMWRCEMCDVYEQAKSVERRRAAAEWLAWPVTRYLRKRRKANPGSPVAPAHACKKRKQKNSKRNDGALRPCAFIGSKHEAQMPVRPGACVSLQPHLPPSRTYALSLRPVGSEGVIAARRELTRRASKLFGVARIPPPLPVRQELLPPENARGISYLERKRSTTQSGNPGSFPAAQCVVPLFPFPIRR